MLRFSKELAFLVATGRHADTALWYQRMAAATAAQQAQEAQEAASAEADGGGGNATSSEAPPAAWPGAAAGGGAGFLAAALEGSSNSSRLDAKLAVWSTLWEPLLPQHWLRAALAAGASTCLSVLNGCAAGAAGTPGWLCAAPAARPPPPPLPNHPQTPARWRA